MKTFSDDPKSFDIFGNELMEHSSPIVKKNNSNLVLFSLKIISIVSVLYKMSL